MTAQVDIANLVLVYIIFAVSLNLLMGYTGQPTMAHAAFGAVGGYATALLSAKAGLPFLLVLVIAVAMGAVLGLVVAGPAHSLGSEFLILITFAVLVIIQSLIGSVSALGGSYGITGTQPMKIGGLMLDTAWRTFAVLGIVALAVTALCWKLGESQLGVALRAIRDDEDAAEAAGRSVAVIKMKVFVLTAAIAALAGALLVYYEQVVSSSMFDASQTISLIAMVVIGGSGSIKGSVLGAVIVTAAGPLLEATVHLSPDKASIVQLMFYGLILVVVVTARPGGIIPERRRGYRLAGEPAPTVTATAGPHGVARKAAGPGPGGAPETPARSLPPREGGRAEPAVVVRGLTKRFGGLTAVEGVDLQLPAGQVTGLIGPNGAGKSTLFGLFTGTILPDRGRVELFGRNVIGLAPHEVVTLGMARSFQDVRLFGQLSVVENVILAALDPADERLLPQVLGGRARRARRARVGEVAREALEFVGLAGRGDEVAASLSYAEQKLVAIARTLATGARVLLLDEPTSGVDAEWVERIAGLIRELPATGRTVCIVEHNLTFMRYLDADCYFMVAGKVRAHGKLDALMADAEMRLEYFGTE